jgi:hypothetical protein
MVYSLAMVDTSTTPPTAEVSAPTCDFDNLLFEAFLRYGLSRDHLAQAINNPNLTTLEILAWLDQPHIAQARAAVRRFANESAAVTLALSQVQAINTLAHLTTTSPDPTQQRLAATTLLRAANPSSRSTQRAHPRTVRHRAARHPSPQDNPHLTNNPPALNPNSDLPIQSSSPSYSAPSAPSAISSKPTDLQEVPDPQHLESLIQTLDQTIADLDPDLDPDQDADLDDAEETPQEREEGERAYQFFMSLGVPLSHPDIINAIAEGRGSDLESIAARIRAESPRAP